MEQALINAWVAAAIALFASASWSQATAQTVRGTVVDSSTSQAISGVTVELADSDSHVVSRASTGRNGEFRLRGRGAGSYRLHARRIGYRTLVVDSLVLPAVIDTTIDVRLKSVPVELDPVAVTGEEPYLKTSGFYERKTGGVGTFLDPQQVEKLAPKATYVVDVLDKIPGVSILTRESHGRTRLPHLRTCRTISRRAGWNPGVQPPSSITPESFRSDATMFPRLYVDGLAVTSEAFETLLPTDILAVEVYMGPAQIPLQYGGTDAPCGVILLWTKH